VTILVPSLVVPSGLDQAGQVLTQVYGSFTTACTQTAVSTAGANRVTGLTPKRRYVVYAYVSSGSFSGIAMKCIQGSGTIDVTGVNGKKIYAGQQEIWFVQGGNTAISCQTDTGSGVYDVCSLD
jgi:hypothetical protein